jgi:hypothetical protein
MNNLHFICETNAAGNQATNESPIPWKVLFDSDTKYNIKDGGKKSRNSHRKEGGNELHSLISQINDDWSRLHSLFYPRLNSCCLRKNSKEHQESKFPKRGSDINAVHKVKELSSLTFSSCFLLITHQSHYGKSSVCYCFSYQIPSSLNLLIPVIIMHWRPRNIPLLSQN